MCDFLTDEFRGEECSFNAGGVSEMYLASHDEIATSTLNTGKSAVTAITFKTDSKKFLKVHINPESGDFQDVFSRNGSSKFMKPSLTFNIAANDEVGIEASHSIILHKTVALIKLNSGIWKVAGLKNGLVATAASANSGVKAEDESGRNFTLTGVELGFAPVISEVTAKTYIYVAPEA